MGQSVGVPKTQRSVIISWPPPHPNQTNTVAYTRIEVIRLHETSLALGDAFASAYRTFGPDALETRCILEIYKAARRALPKPEGGKRYGSADAHYSTQHPTGLSL